MTLKSKRDPRKGGRPSTQRRASETPLPLRVRSRTAERTGPPASAAARPPATAKRQPRLKGPGGRGRAGAGSASSALSRPAGCRRSAPVRPPSRGGREQPRQRARVGSRRLRAFSAGARGGDQSGARRRPSCPTACRARRHALPPLPRAHGHLLRAPRAHVTERPSSPTPPPPPPPPPPPRSGPRPAERQSSSRRREARVLRLWAFFGLRRSGPGRSGPCGRCVEGGPRTPPTVLSSQFSEVFLLVPF